MVKKRNIVLFPQKGGASVMRMPPTNMMDAVVMEPRRRPSRSATMESTSMPVCIAGARMNSKHTKHKLGRIFECRCRHALAQTRQVYVDVPYLLSQDILERQRLVRPHTMIPANSLYEIVCSKP